MSRKCTVQKLASEVSRTDKRTLGKLVGGRGEAYVRKTPTLNLINLPTANVYNKAIPILPPPPFFSYFFFFFYFICSHTRILAAHPGIVAYLLSYVQFFLSDFPLAPRGGLGCLVSPSCLEPQGCHLISLFCLLSSSSSAYFCCSFCL